MVGTRSSAAAFLRDLEEAKKQSLEHLELAPAVPGMDEVMSNNSDEHINDRVEVRILNTPPRPNQNIMILLHCQQMAMKFPPGSRVWHTTNVHMETGKIGNVRTWVSTVCMVYLVHESVVHEPEKPNRIAYQLGNPDFHVYAWEEDLVPAVKTEE
ncbi:hypothetical protein THAOC_17298 [Thalassiosira oceanica]|uniref:Uncharacterized protein n=1 Tax=Thalassiosira oceanica TaxID=159749 RepID=K0S7K7_THAOC|nr:hypothetical protein THAOC_17298 [Thalassiosira oceanica]|eukprot:EJK62103.1 hypothetical protein THAOC_17298 [Thalassiosira oceanica]